MNVEGIIIQKTPYKERDLICNVLLRSGRTIAVYFYGGRGGGKSLKGSIIEVGFMLKIQLSERRKKVESDIQIAKEYKLLWDGEQIRDDFKSFYLLSFFLEYIAKVSPLESIGKDTFESGEHAGLFNVLSNTLFYLNDSIKNKKIDYQRTLFIFLAKLSLHLGINPEVDNCSLCSKTLKDGELCLFDHQDGGFVCYECTSQKGELLSDNRLGLEELKNSNLLRGRYKRSLRISFKDYSNIDEISQGQVVALFNYINFQFGIGRDQIKTWGMVSSY